MLAWRGLALASQRQVQLRSSGKPGRHMLGLARKSRVLISNVQINLYVPHMQWGICNTVPAYAIRGYEQMHRVSCETYLQWQYENDVLGQSIHRE